MAKLVPICTIGPECWNEVLRRFDITVFKLINSGLSCRVMDHVMVTATILGEGKYLAIMCLGFLMFGKYARRSDWFQAGMAGLAAIIMSTITVAICKQIFNRPRPLLSLFDVNTPHKTLFGQSFPSGHTMTAFAVAFACCMLVPKLRWVLIPFAFILAVSRVYVGVHYPLDVMYGGLVGSFLGITAASIVKNKYAGKKLLPRETEKETV